MSWPPERLKNGFMMSGKGAPGLGDSPEHKSFVYFTQARHRAASAMKLRISFADGKMFHADQIRDMEIPLMLTLNPENTVAISYQNVKVTLKQGEWSNYVPIKYPNGRRAIVKWKPERVNAAAGDWQLYRYRLLQDPTCAGAA